MPQHAATFYSEPDRIQESVTYIRSHYPHCPKLAIILGSGLGHFATQLQTACFLPLKRLPYEEIPHFGRSTVAGHSGELLLGELENSGLHVCVMAGRFHYYEGFSPAQITYPIRVLAKLGIQTLVVTNAAGILNPSFEPADLMLMTDHINQLGFNPLLGGALEADMPRFIDMTHAYNSNYAQTMKSIAQAYNIPLREGVYCAVSGPSYETPAEVRFYRQMGGDAIGMSTVPEVLMARQYGIEVVGVSCLTNYAAGLTPNHILTHEEVLETAQKAEGYFPQLILGFCQQYH